MYTKWWITLYNEKPSLKATHDNSTFPLLLCLHFSMRRLSCFSKFWFFPRKCWSAMMMLVSFHLSAPKRKYSCPFFSMKEPMAPSQFLYDSSRMTFDTCFLIIQNDCSNTESRLIINFIVFYGQMRMSLHHVMNLMKKISMTSACALQPFEISLTEI